MCQERANTSCYTTTPGKTRENGERQSVRHCIDSVKPRRSQDGTVKQNKRQEREDGSQDFDHTDHSQTLARAPINQRGRSSAPPKPPSRSAWRPLAAAGPHSRARRRPCRPPQTPLRLRSVVKMCLVLTKAVDVEAGSCRVSVGSRMCLAPPCFRGATAAAAPAGPTHPAQQAPGLIAPGLIATVLVALSVL